MAGESSESQGDFKLSAVLQGHSSDVRAVILPDPSFAVTASRDGTVRVWKQTSQSPPTFDATESSNGAQFKTCLSYLTPVKEYPEGLIISSGQDALIEAKQPGRTSNDNADGFMVGHAGQVCSLDVSAEAGFIVSGSWDFSARVWGIGRWEPEVELPGHDAAVWAVLAYDKDTIVTGCADQGIRVFDARGKLRNSFGGKNVVRALAKLPEGHPSTGEIVAATNDGVIRIWSLKGDLIAELFGHENFIYSLAVLPNGEIVSSGEDRSVRIWRGIECIQVITLPAISVWSVSTCPNGDIIAGSSDKTARIFTRDLKRIADPSILAEFTDAVKASAIPAQQVGQLNKTDMPGPEYLEQKSGTKEGQHQMIKEADGSVILYAWSVSEQMWQKIGEVVDSEGSSGNKTAYNGKEYDYVFDIDIEDGKPALKLPFNAIQNPYEAATKFLSDNELPMTYLEETANFIIKNTQGTSLGSQSQQPVGLDPMGTESRYRPGDVSSYQPPKATSKKLPVKYYVSITAGKPDAAYRQILKLNDQYKASGGSGSELTSTELNSLAQFVDQLKNYDWSQKASLAVSPGLKTSLPVILKIGTQWVPPANRLAGLDLLRFLAAGAKEFPSISGDGRDAVELVIASGAFDPDVLKTNSKLAMISIRFILNLVYGSDDGRTLFRKHLSAILENVKTVSSLAASDVSLAMAVTTFYVNLAVFITSPEQAHDDGNNDHGLTIIEQLTEILSSLPTATNTAFGDALQQTTEPAFRGIMALGTVIIGLNNDDLKVAARDVFEVPKVLEQLQERKFLQEPRFKEIVAEITAALR